MKNRIIVVLVGIIFLGVGVFLFIRGNNLKNNCTEKVDAYVINYTESYSDDSFTYCPVIEYNVNGITYNKEYSTCGSVKKYQLKQKISILYNPNKVEEFYIEGDSTSGIFSYIFMGAGIFVIIIGLIGKIDGTTKEVISE